MASLPMPLEDKDQSETRFTHSPSSDTSDQPIASVPFVDRNSRTSCITQRTAHYAKAFFLRMGLGHTLFPFFTPTDRQRLLQLDEMCWTDRESMCPSLKFEVEEKQHTLLPTTDYLHLLHEIQGYVSANSKHTRSTQYSLGEYIH